MPDPPPGFGRSAPLAVPPRPLYYPGSRLPGCPMTDHRAAQERWNRYWEHGFVTSCSGAFSGNYEGTLKTVWERFVAECPPGSRVLDICTGNGAIAMIANQVGRSRDLNLEIHAIDSATSGRWPRCSRTAICSRASTSIRRHPPNRPRSRTAFSTPSPANTPSSTPMRPAVSPSWPGSPRRAVACSWSSITPARVVIETSREELSNGALIMEETRIFDLAEALMERVGAARTRPRNRPWPGIPRRNPAARRSIRRRNP